MGHGGNVRPPLRRATEHLDPYEFHISIIFPQGPCTVRFLITNDDGFDAPGLTALYQSLLPLGDVTVVAPATCHSSKGHAVDTKNAIRVERRHVEPFGEIHIVHSTPADCIRVGIRHLLKSPPDFVVAGINPGANLGVDLFYSGTAAAAREAALLGVPAIALSRLLHGGFPVNWAVLSKHVTRVVRRIMEPEYQLPIGHFWNINFPTVAEEEYPGEMTLAPHGTEPHAVAFKVIEKSGNFEILEYSAVYRDRARSEQCDVHHVFEQRITATPVGPSLTSGPAISMQSRVSLSNATCAD
jgi:5'-nucleotidase